MIPENCVVMTPDINGWYLNKFFAKFGANKVVIEYSGINVDLPTIVASAEASGSLVLISDYLTSQRMAVEAAYLCGRVGITFLIASPTDKHFIVRNYSTGECCQV